MTSFGLILRCVIISDRPGTRAKLAEAYCCPVYALCKSLHMLQLHLITCIDDWILFMILNCSVYSLQMVPAFTLSF